MKRFSFHSGSPTETIKFGSRLSKYFLPGTVVALKGGLGSGKTTLIQGMAKGLGVAKQEVKSPTFVIFHVYNGKFPVYHFDLYRLENPKELEAIGFDEFVSDAGAISFIEWANHAGSNLPDDLLTVHLKDMGESHREFKMEAQGVRSQKILKAFSKK